MRSLNTHLYPGARLLPSQPAEPEFKPGDILTITFSDTVQAKAEVIGTSENIARISVAGYRTKRGAAIVSKTWFIRKVVPIRGSVCYLVVGRAFSSPATAPPGSRAAGRESRRAASGR
jgi:hypothetical protein